MHDAELSRLPRWIARIVGRLAAGEHPDSVATALGVTQRAVYAAQAAARRVLGSDSPIVLSTRRNRRPGGPCSHFVEPTAVRLWTTEANGHRHVASFNDNGAGCTEPDASGHVHRIRDLDLQPSAGHSHALTTERA